MKADQTHFEKHHSATQLPSVAAESAKNSPIPPLPTALDQKVPQLSEEPGTIALIANDTAGGAGKIADGELTALNAAIHTRGAKWSQKARAIKFEIEFNATEQERRRVAKELHDEILPNMARLIRSVQQRQAEPPAPVELVHELHATVAAVRDLLGELHPVDLLELGLVPALINISKRCSRVTGRTVLFIEKDEDCLLTEQQQLYIYRAIQTVLRMFANCENDILVVAYNRIAGNCVISMRCIDKRVSGARWLSAESHMLDSLQSWCAMAGANIAFSAQTFDETSHDLVITIPEGEPERKAALVEINGLTKERLQELDSIVDFAQEEWSGLLNNDCWLFKDMALETERRRIFDEINKLILPHLCAILRFAEKSRDLEIRNMLRSCMRSIVAAIKEIMSETLPRELAQADLLSSVKALTQRFKRASLIETNVISALSCAEVSLTPEAKFAIYRVIQESLNNVEKHSDASRVQISIAFVGNLLTIDIEDNGKGFQECRRIQSRGLRNIRERAVEIGASVFWHRSRSFNSGTRVQICLRCSRPNPASSKEA
jgi:signal transduction histidine kinase